ncbi:MAG: DNA polymerase III subunit delta [Deltaproteobacteria bacterium HGW-Deltaproteobacteria-15]|jgi:DNA polymerase-3 subunit delta|nr:MAG: DNA polymerase III subunit delta [Deltaproteobacteria bacterium HGW-Deltaproteobacteria-15]
MPRDLAPAQFEQALKKGQIAPFYLFHGPNEFLVEKALEGLKEKLVPESARAFNLEIFYGGESAPADIVSRARSIPFLATRRLVIVRRAEAFGAEALDRFNPYLENPAESTCLVFVCAKADFKKGVFKSIRAAGRAVQFEDLREPQVAPWIKRTAAELGLRMDLETCLYLQQVTGNDTKDLYGELEKIRMRYGKNAVTLEEVSDTVAHTRSFTIFDLMTLISKRECGPSMAALSRFLEEEDKKSGPLRFLGMLNRQMRLLFRTKEIVGKGGGKREVEEMLGRARLSADEFLSAAKRWSLEELRKGLALLYEADGQLKRGSSTRTVLDNLLLRLCSRSGLR